MGDNSCMMMQHAREIKREKHDWYAYGGGELCMIACRKCGSVRPVRLPIDLADLPGLTRTLAAERSCPGKFKAKAS